MTCLNERGVGTFPQDVLDCLARVPTIMALGRVGEARGEQEVVAPGASGGNVAHSALIIGGEDLDGIVERGDVDAI